jgi:hypothetical protein
MKDEQDVEARLAELELTVTALKARIGELEDDRAIRDLLARYGYNADSCRDDAYIALYTDDGSIVLTGAQASAAHGGKGTVSWHGKEELRSFISDPNGHHRAGYYGNYMHLQGNNLVTHIVGDEAVANSYSVVFVGEGDGVKLLSAGNNQWQLRKVDDQWLIKERRRSQVGDDHYISNLDATPE